MSEDNKYNGWTNYETWLVKLWLDNDEGSQGYWNEQAANACESAEADRYFTRKERAALNLSDTLKDEIDNNAQELTGVTGMYADLLNAALSEVNWHEIAEAMIDDIDFDFSEDEEPEEVEE